jgi:hypothetical protein
MTEKRDSFFRRFHQCQKPRGTESQLVCPTRTHGIGGCASDKNNFIGTHKKSTGVLARKGSTDGDLSRYCHRRADFEEFGISSRCAANWDVV